MSQEGVSSGNFLVKRAKSLVVRRKPDSIGEVIGAFESDTIAVFVRTAPVSQHITVYVLTGMLILAIALSAVIKLDRVVTSQEGFIMTGPGSIYVSPFDMGIVRQVNVKVGDVVKKGDSLATLDPTFTQADLTQLKEHMASDIAQIAREKAELARQRYVYSKTDHYQAIQGALWEQRQGEFLSSVNNYQSQIQSTTAQMSQAKSDVEKYTTRLKIADDINGMYAPLVEKGYVAGLQLMQATDTRTELSRLLEDARNQIEQYRQTVEALRAQLAAYVKTWDAATSTQLVADENDRNQTQDSLDKAQKMQDLTSLDAPEDGIVTKIGQVSKGSVQAGAAGVTTNLQQDPLFTLTPLNAPVEGEIDVSTQDVGFIRVGDRVILKVDTFPYIRFGRVLGKVKFISEESYAIDQNGLPVNPYYKVRVTITEYQMHNVPKDFRLIPGMTLEGDVVVGDRTILSYLTEGAMRMGSEGMREP